MRGDSTLINHTIGLPIDHPTDNAHNTPLSPDLTPAHVIGRVDMACLRSERRASTSMLNHNPRSLAAYILAPLGM